MYCPDFPLSLRSGGRPLQIVQIRWDNSAVTHTPAHYIPILSQVRNCRKIFSVSEGRGGGGCSFSWVWTTNCRTPRRLIRLLVYDTPDYKDVSVGTLGEVVSLMHKLLHDTVYKKFYKLYCWL